MIDDLNFSGTVSLSRSKTPSIDLDRLADEEGVPRELVRGMKGAEGQSSATSGAGAQGDLQVLPSTGLRYVKPAEWNTREGKARAGVRYIRDLVDKYGIENADQIAAAYHAGEGNVDNAIKSGRRLPHTPDRVVGAARGKPFYTDTDYVPRFKSAYQNPQTQHLNFSQAVGESQTNALPEVPQLDFSGAVDQPDASVQGRGAAMVRSRQPTAELRRARRQNVTSAIPLLGTVRRMRKRIAEGTIQQPASERGFAGNPLITVNRAQARANEQLREQAESAQAEKVKQAVRASAPPGFSLLPESTQEWVGGAIAKGAGGLAELGAGVARDIPYTVPIVGLTQLALGTNKSPYPVIADKLNRAAQEINVGTMAADRKAARGMLSQTAQDVLGGSISSAPAMALVSLGVPAPVAFGLQSYLGARGQDAELGDLITETTKGATIGALFDLPVPAKLNALSRIGARAGIVGTGTYGLEKLSGSKDAGKNAFVNALFAAMGAGREAPKAGLRPIPEVRTREIPVPNEPMSIAPEPAFRRAGANIETRTGQFVDGVGEVSPSPNQRGVKAGFVRVLRHADGGQQIVPANTIVEKPAFKMNVPEAQPAEAVKPKNQVQIPQVEFVPNLGEVERGNQQGVKRGFVRVIVNGQQHIVPESQIQQGRRIRTAQLGEKPYSVVRNFDNQEFFLPQEGQHPANFQPRRVRNTENGNKGQFKTGASSYDTEATETPNEGVRPNQGISTTSGETIQPNERVETPTVDTRATQSQLITKPRTEKPIIKLTPREPEVRASRLAQSVEAKAIEAKLTQGFEGLPEYEKVNVKDQAEKATKLLQSDPDKATRIAMGKELSSGDLLPESVFTAVENQALNRGDVETLRNLATSSSLSLEATGMGQRIRMLAERNPNSAVFVMRDVQKTREARVGKNVKDRIKTEIKMEIKKAAPKARDWQSFLSEIACK